VAAYETGRPVTCQRAVPLRQPGEPTIDVDAVPVRVGRVDQHWTLYGTVSPLSSTVHTYALAFEVRIERLHVAVGQHVAANVPLFDSRRSPAAAVAADGAADLMKEAGQRLDQVVARQRDGLATREELIQAQGRLRRAQQQVAALQRTGQLSPTHTTSSLQAGVVSSLTGQVGALIPAGNVVLNIAEDASVGVQVWAEPARARSLAAGMAVSVEGLGVPRSTPSKGRVLRVDERVDSATRLVRVLVILDRPSSLLLGQAVRVQIAVSSADGLIVPRGSLVVSDGQSRVFTIENGRARAHLVTAIVDTGDEVLIRGDGLAAEQRVITRGAYQAEDGMRVEVDP